jgi:hypothetical protein
MATNAMDPDIPIVGYYWIRSNGTHDVQGSFKKGIPI